MPQKPSDSSVAANPRDAVHLLRSVVIWGGVREIVGDDLHARALAALDSLDTPSAANVSVPLDVAQKLLDIATESLDWGSGFLDDEEVEALRQFAVTIGSDPWEATPHNHRPKYCPGHQWRDRERPKWANAGAKWSHRVCTVCQLNEWTTG